MQAFLRWGKISGKKHTPDFFEISAVFWCCGALRKEKEGGGGEGERGEEEERGRGGEGKRGGGERREGGRRDFTTVFLPITTCNIDTSE